MPKLTTSERERIMDEVEAVMMSGKWSGRAQHQLARRHDVTRRTIQNYRAVIERRWRNAAKIEDIETERSGWIFRCRQYQQLCVSAEKYRDLSSFMAMEARVLGIEQNNVNMKHSGGLALGHVALDLTGSTTEDLARLLEG